jgi:ubiquinone/menaquinone biosynthesis C-methylase UbiE
MSHPFKQPTQQPISSAFDATAATFERDRPLPSGVPEAIRSAIWQAAPVPAPARVLDMGAGTGRFGKAFVAAGDLYIGVDLSFPMLWEFRASSGSACLVQADGEQLPFRDGSFDVVMLMQVLSGAGSWRGVLNETRRVVRTPGVIVVGHTVSSPEGMNAQLKHQLNLILEEMNVVRHQPQQARHEALAWLESSASRPLHLCAASWTASTTPREFLARHRTGARFTALPPSIQEDALHQLGAWAKTAFGSLDVAFPEERTFELDIFEF